MSKVDELKSKNENLFQRNTILVNQLAKAKEIIKQFLNDYPVITKELLDKLEQFIKEE